LPHDSTDEATFVHTAEHSSRERRDSKSRGNRLIRDALSLLETRARQPGVLLNSHAVAANWFRLKLAEYEHEVFAAAWLDNRRRLIVFEELFRGTLDRTSVPAREVVKAALRHNAAAVLFAHNHPSGSVVASGADLALTLELSRALDLIDVHLLDHFVVSANVAPQSVWTDMSVLHGSRKTNALCNLQNPSRKPEIARRSANTRATDAKPVKR
jgi:DNA repair protein RadC